MPNVSRILCPVDFSDTLTHAVEQAAAIAGWYKARLTGLHVYTSCRFSGLPAPADRVPDFDWAIAAGRFHNERHHLRGVARNICLAIVGASLGSMTKHHASSQVHLVTHRHTDGRCGSASRQRSRRSVPSGRFIPSSDIPFAAALSRSSTSRPRSCSRLQTRRELTRQRVRLHHGLPRSQRCHGESPCYLKCRPESFRHLEAIWHCA